MKICNGNSDEREYHGNKSIIQFNLPNPTNPSPLLPPPLKTSGQWNLVYSFLMWLLYDIWNSDLSSQFLTLNGFFLAWTDCLLTILFIHLDLTLRSSDHVRNNQNNDLLGDLVKKSCLKLEQSLPQTQTV